MKQILVTTDLSSKSKGGIRFAIQLALQTNNSLIVYHVVEILKPTSWSDVHFKKFKDSKIAEVKHAIDKILLQICDKRTLNKLKVETRIDFGVNASELIMQSGKKLKVSFICMSTRGAGKYEKLLGTVASELITKSTRPVVVVPQNYKIKKIDKLFFACDFANLGTEIKTVQLLCSELKAELQVFHYDYMLHVEEIRNNLQKKVSKYLNTKTSVHFKRQEIEKPLHEHFATDIARSKPALVVLFAKQNKNWFDRIFVKSESTDLAFNVKVPLLTYRKKIN